MTVRTYSNLSLEGRSRGSLLDSYQDQATFDLGNSRVDFGFYSGKGKRRSNADAIVLAGNDELVVSGVFDAIGTRHNSDVASALATYVVRHSVGDSLAQEQCEQYMGSRTTDSSLANQLANLLDDVNGYDSEACLQSLVDDIQTVLQQSKVLLNDHWVFSGDLEQYGTTVALQAFSENQQLRYHQGDSSHLWIDDEFEMGWSGVDSSAIISSILGDSRYTDLGLREMIIDARRSILTKALPIKYDPQRSAVVLDAAKVTMSSSDALGKVSNRDLFGVLSSDAVVDQKVQQLVDLAGQTGTRDNISVIVARLNRTSN